MTINPISFDHARSAERIQDILAVAEGSFQELDYIPADDQLTFNNGFYVNCAALMVDVRESSSLPQAHRRPVLAKIYRAYLSEVCAVLVGRSEIRSISIRGDGVLGIFDINDQTSTDPIFFAAAQICSVMKVLNYHLLRRGYTQVRIGIGLEWGRALMVKAGFPGSSVNDVVWLGDVVNRATKLSNFGNKSLDDYPIFLGDLFVRKLSREDYKEHVEWNAGRAEYHAHVVSQLMDDWYEANCL